MNAEQLLTQLATRHWLESDEMRALLAQALADDALRQRLYALARGQAVAHYGYAIYIRGLIELSNHCRRDCYYCGIRRSNRALPRYRLSADQVLACCESGYALGFRSFVLQGGEDPFFDDDAVVQLVSGIKSRFADCAVTLSLGEYDPESYRRFGEAGADRYLLRHETATATHYARLHPPEQRLERRLACIRSLQQAGYQTGMGLMVGSPFQGLDELVADLVLLRDYRPEMVGIGPFIPQHDTPFANKPAGGLTETLVMLAMTRLLLPAVMLPATTALGSIDPEGREKGILAGANVVMPNLSPPETREHYALYDNKLSSGAEAAENLRALSERLSRIGYHVAFATRGDYRPIR